MYYEKNNNMKNTFILHGSFGSPFENWFPWLHDTLAKAGKISYVLNMPTPNDQTFKSWAAILDGYSNAGLINENSIFVCHSSACPMVLKYSLNRAKKFLGLVTVSGFNNYKSGNLDFDNLNSEFFLESSDLISAGKNFAKRISFYSENDPYLPLTELESFSNYIDAEKRVIHNAGHFNESAGYTTFEDILPILELL